MRHEKTTERVLAAAFEIHTALGPGLLESVYEECMAHEFHLRRMPYQRQVPLPLTYKGIELDCGYRMDFVVEGQVVVELKCVEAVLPVHEAQLRTYLKLSGKTVGLILNFSVGALRDGIVRQVW